MTLLGDALVDGCCDSVGYLRWIAEEQRFAAQTFVAEEAGAMVGDDGDRALEARAELGRVGRAMATLPDEQREAVALVLVEGLAYKEAAAVLDIPIGTLTSRLVRGRTALIEKLGKAA